MDEIKNYPPYLDYPKPYKPQENTNYIRAMSDEEAFAASRRRIVMAKCTGMRCPMHIGYKVDQCEHKDCHYRTEPLTNADYFRACLTRNSKILLEGFGKLKILQIGLDGLYEKIYIYFN